MLSHRPGISGARLLEQFRPLIRIELLGGELRDEILVAKFIHGTISRQMMPIYFIVGLIHVVGIPLTAVGRNRIRAPMEIDPELGVVIPLRRGMIGYRLPTRGVETRGHPGRQQGDRASSSCRCLQ